MVSHLEAMHNIRRPAVERNDESIQNQNGRTTSSSLYLHERHYHEGEPMHAPAQSTEVPR